MSWRGTDRVIKAVKRKLNVVVTPSSHLYFDSSEKNGESRIPLQAVYAFNPVPDELNAQQAKYILGAQACVWTENVTSMEQVEKIALPRMAALAEVVWADKNQHNFADFIRRMAIQYPRYDVMKLNYRAPDLEGGFNGLHIFTDSALVKFIAPHLNSKVHYTLDGSRPTRQSALYIKPFYLKKSAALKAAEFFPDGETGRVRSGIYEKQRPLQAVERKDFKPGIIYQYTEGKYDSTTQIKKREIKNRGTIKSFILPANHRKHFFAVIYKGFIHIKKDGIYYFYCESNDGSRLYIQEKLVVDHDGLHPAEEKEGVIALKAGYHAMRLIYFQNAGSSALKVSYKGKGIGKQEIPASVLFH
jgi:hexosaminidase